MRIRLVKRDGRKAAGFFEKNKGTIFEVIEKYPEGYDVDLAPLGHPGERGWMYRGEVEIVV